MVGNSVEHLFTHLAHEGQHGAHDFSYGRDVVLRDPLGQLEELRGEDRFVVEDVEDVLGFNRRRLVVNTKDYPGHLFVAERDEDTGSDGRSRFAERISEGAIKGDRQGYVAESWHLLQGTRS